MNPHRIPGKHHYSPEELAATLHVHKEPNPNITDLETVFNRSEGFLQAFARLRNKLESEP